MKRSTHQFSSPPLLEHAPKSFSDSRQGRLVVVLLWLGYNHTQCDYDGKIRFSSKIGGRKTYGASKVMSDDEMTSAPTSLSDKNRTASFDPPFSRNPKAACSTPYDSRGSPNIAFRTSRRCFPPEFPFSRFCVPPPGSRDTQKSTHLRLLHLCRTAEGEVGQSKFCQAENCRSHRQRRSSATLKPHRANAQDDTITMHLHAGGWNSGTPPNPGTAGARRRRRAAGGGRRAADGGPAEFMIFVCGHGACPSQPARVGISERLALTELVPSILGYCR
ncbi:hypothetical protein EVAR_7572_1 [Eumeta japonica]|uniref:Uncharacterized protein n=1 Tax=Eumeta variegata TaxID=151549 RepID=A0A4C1VPI0_EUMVA|nr:hypothetical protein EVAR_7572_1 [Eumeta japonica]